MTEKTVPPIMGNCDQPLVSVVLPVYNGEKYLAEAIDSILAQTFGDFELIMIDDGSTDRSRGILREYEKKDARVRVIVRENRGLATTLNDSIDIARGTWIARMDQDDIALPVRFERQLAWLGKTGADICGSWVRRFGSADKRVVRLRQSDEAIKTELLFCSPLAHPTVMMRADLVRGLRYDSAWEKAEDYDLWERAAEAGWKMTNVPEVLLMYRQHEAQISTSTLTRQEQLAQQIRRRYWDYFFQGKELDQQCIEQVLGIRDPGVPRADMNVVNIALAKLLQRSRGEAQEAVWGHAERLYLRAAADTPDIVEKWNKLNRDFGRRAPFMGRLKLWVLRNLQTRRDSRLFSLLRKLHISIFRNT